MSGDEWKKADDKPRPPVKPCRAVLQSLSDRDYVEGELTLEQWRAQFEVYAEMRGDGSF